MTAVQMVVEVGDWEHECCGPAYERDTVVELTCMVVPGRDGGPPRYVESHHDLSTSAGLIQVHGRVADLVIEHLDGTVDPISRLPSGQALRGFDDRDDGHLERPWTGDPVVNDSSRFLITVVH